MIALLASGWGAPAIAAACGVALVAGYALCAACDRAITTARRHLNPTGSHRR